MWEDYRDEVYVFTHTDEGKEIYAKRKEKIERSFAESKELHGLRYCRMRGNERVSEQCLLKEVGLIAEKRQGLNKPNLIYIGKIDYSVPEQPKNSDENSDNSSDSKAIPTDIEKLNVRTFNNSTSGVLNDKCQDFEKVNTNKTDINNPNKNNTDFNETESKKYKAEQKNSSFVNSS